MKPYCSSKLLLLTLSCGLLFSSCKKDEDGDNLEPMDAPSGAELLVRFDNSGTPITPEFTTIADGSNNLVRPTDVAFSTARDNELWVLNERIAQTGGSTVTITNPNTENPSFDARVDGNAWHFMSLPTALAWNDNGNWATSPGIQDANHSGGTFTGPTLWSGDMNVYARPSGGNGSHLDMLHGSPYSMGIEAETGNIYWVFDGWNQELVRYDFKADHGPGNDYHGDGEVLRYRDVALQRHPDGVPSHMRFDENQEWLYICEGAKRRVIRVRVDDAQPGSNLPLINEQLAKHQAMTSAKVETFISDGVLTPCGIEIFNGTIYISDFESGEIIAYSEETGNEIARVDTGNPGITGLCAGNGHLWFVNKSDNKLVRVDP